MTAVLVILLLALILFAFCTGGRTGHPGLKDLQGWSYAHRGLHGGGIPENSMAAFRAALDRGYGIELDVHLLKDGNLAVIHDSALVRTTGAPGRIEDLATEDLKNYPLEGTGETIPTFREVLELYAGKAPLIVELKAENKNHAALARTACEQLEDYPGVYCIESFDPRCILWLKKNRPRILRGQLSQNFFRSEEKLSPAVKFLLTHNLTHFVTRPDFIAYRFRDRKLPGNFLCRRIRRVQGVSWTLRTQQEYDIATREGWLPIFEYFTP